MEWSQPRETSRMAPFRATSGESRGIATVGSKRAVLPPQPRGFGIRARGSNPAPFLRFTVGTGKLSNDHCLLDPGVGGGRLVGEGCHFVDLARCLVGRPIRA